jgi:hypothetical protein
MSDEENRSLTRRDDEVTDVAEVIPAAALAIISKSEVESQLDAAHRYPRVPSRAVADAISQVTATEQMAAACSYTLRRREFDAAAGTFKEKLIVGPSVRLAEVAASCWGNMHIGTRQIEVGERDVTTQAVAWDLERNLRITVESKRRITTSKGKRYSDDMIIVTQNANASIAFRNSVLRVIPRVYIDRMYEAARKCAVGDLATLPAKRAKILGRLAEMGVTEKRVLTALGKASVDDILIPDLEILIGLGTSIRDGLMTIADAFPEPAAPAADLAATNGRESVKPQAPAPAAQPAQAENLPERWASEFAIRLEKEGPFQHHLGPIPRNERDKLIGYLEAMGIKVDVEFASGESTIRLTKAPPATAPQDTAGQPPVRRAYARRGRPETGVAGSVTVVNDKGEVIARGERETGADDDKGDAPTEDEWKNGGGK